MSARLSPERLPQRQRVPSARHSVGAVPTRAGTRGGGPRQETPSAAAGGTAARETGMATSKVPADSAVPHTSGRASPRSL